jgi:hypothetical protein
MSRNGQIDSNLTRWRHDGTVTIGYTLCVHQKTRIWILFIGSPAVANDADAGLPNRSEGGRFGDNLGKREDDVINPVTIDNGNRSGDCKTHARYSITVQLIGRSTSTR